MTRANPADRAFGKWVEAARRARGLTQTDLARLVSPHCQGWHQQTVVKVEKGQRPPLLSEALVLARLFDHEIKLPAGVDLPELPQPPCSNCLGQPPTGFTCDSCGASTVTMLPSQKMGT